MGSLTLQDAIGLRGESIFSAALTKLYGRPEPLFNPRFLGEKYPAVDYIVELNTPSTRIISYFFVQVKTTRAGYTKREHRLKVKVLDKDVTRLVALPAPTYVVGVDEVNEATYIVSANGRYTRGLSSLSTRFHSISQPKSYYFRKYHGFGIGLTLGNSIHCLLIRSGSDYENQWL